MERKIAKREKKKREKGKVKILQKSAKIDDIRLYTVISVTQERYRPGTVPFEVFTSVENRESVPFPS